MSLLRQPATSLDVNLLLGSCTVTYVYSEVATIVYNGYITMGLYSYSTLEVIISQYSYYGFIAGSCWKNMFSGWGREKLRAIYWDFRWDFRWGISATTDGFMIMYCKPV